MSTWTTASYRPDALRNVYRYLPRSAWTSRVALSLADWDVEDPGTHPLPRDLHAGPFRPQLVKDPDLMDELLPPFKHQPSESFNITLQEFDGAYFGLDAVYRLANFARTRNAADVRSGAAGLSREDAKREEEDLEHTASAFRILLAAGSHTGTDIEPREEVLKGALRQGYYQAKRTIRGLVKAASAGNTVRARKEVIEAELSGEAHPFTERISSGAFRSWRVLRKPGLTILARGEVGWCYVLVGNDVERLERILEGEAYVLTAARLRIPGPSGDLQVERLKAVFSYIFKRAAALPRRDQPLLARAFNVAHYSWMAKVSGSLDPRPELEQSGKWITEGLFRVGSLESILSLYDGLPLKEALELSLVYKVLPPCDYDYFGAANRQEGKSFNRADFKVEPCAGGDWEGILLYHRWLMIYSFHQIHGRCPGILRTAQAEDKYEDVQGQERGAGARPGGSEEDKQEGTDSEESYEGANTDSTGEDDRHHEGPQRDYRRPVEEKEAAWRIQYPHVSPDKIPVREVNEIDFNGDFVYQKRGDDVLDLVKDKGICPAQHRELDGAGDRAKLRLSEKNQLADVLTRADKIDTTAMRFSDVMLDVEADDKAESKKPNSRWFYKAGTDARILQSEYEDSIGKYAVKVPGVIMGLDLEARMKQLAFIREPGNPEGPDITVSWSFDIKGFSANLMSKVHDALNEVWAEAFGEEDLLDASRLFTDGDVVYMKPGVKHVFAKLGVDFEGFAGRKLTTYHCAVMGYVVLLLREEGIITAKGRFGAFIDDGLLRLSIPRDGFRERVARASEVIERVYMAGSMVISWDKTLVSPLLQTFLGDVTAAGRTINPGLKAVTRISNRGTSAIPSLLDDLETLSATCAGAVKAGEHLVPVVGLYSALLTDLLRKWGKGEPKPTINAVIAMLFPIGLGGLGVPNPLALGGSVASNGLQESLGNLKMVGLRMPALCPHINKCLNQHYRRVHVPESVKLQGGVAVKSHAPTLRSDRLQQAVLESLPKVIREPSLKALLSAETNLGTAFTEAQLGAGARIPLELRAALFASSPENYVRKVAIKFTTERAARLCLSNRKLKRIREANRNEAYRVIHFINTGQVKVRM